MLWRVGLQSKLNISSENISILSRNRAHWILADMAICASGNITIPMFTTQSSTVAEYIFDLTNVKVLFLGEAENWEKIRDVVPRDMTIVTFPNVEIDAPSLKWSDITSSFLGKEPKR